MRIDVSELLGEPSSQSKVLALTSKKFILAILIFFLVLGTGLRIFTAFIPIEQQVRICLADDAFYYLQLAQNVLAGNGTSFDGVIRTNGFHPLFLLVCILFSSIFSGQAAVAPILIFLALVGLVNAILLYFVGKRIGGEVAGFVAAVTWAIHPFAQYIEMMGVEAPLAVCAMLATTLWWLKIKIGEKTGKGAWVLLGLMVGVCFLARTDTIFFAIFMTIEILIVSRKKLKDRALPILMSGAVALITVSPWLIWNLSNFGRITQDSGRSIFAYTLGAVKAGGMSYWQAASGETAVAFHDYLLRFVGMTDASMNLLVVFIGIALAVIALVFLKDGRIGLWRGVPSFVFAGLATWGFYNFVFMTRKNWYFLAFLAVGALMFGRLISMLAHRTGQLKWIVALFFLLLLGSNWFEYGRAIEWGGFHPWQQQYLNLAETIRNGQIKAIKPGDTLGAWNSGIYGAFSGHRVVNLDGVVNPNIYDVMKDRRFMQYIQEAGIDHVIDHEIMFQGYQPFATLEMTEYMGLRERYPGGQAAGDILLLTVYKEPIQAGKKKTNEKTKKEPELKQVNQKQP